MILELVNGQAGALDGTLRALEADHPQRPPLGLCYVIGNGTQPVTLTGTTVETTLASVLIPGGLIGPAGSLRLHLLWSTVNNANAKTVRSRLGAVQLSTLNLTTSATARSTSVALARGLGQMILAPGSSDGNSSTAISMVTIDHSSDQNFSVTGQLAAATDFITLEAWQLLLFPAS